MTSTLTSGVRTNAIETFAPMLSALSEWLDRAAAHTSAKKCDAGALMSSRLVADMYPLSTQVQLACHHANDFIARIVGQQPPRLEIAEENFEQLKARIARTVESLRNVSAVAFEGAEERDIVMPLQDNLVLEMKGHQFLRDWALPHFYFHLVTAYDILRYKGVELGKQDYLSHIAYAIRQGADQSV